MTRADVLVALTEAERGSYRALGVDTPIAILPNGTEIPPLRPGAAARVQAAFGIAPDVPMVLFLGRLHPTKGADTLLDAFLRVTDSAPRAVWVIAAPDEWSLQERWRARATRHGAGDRVLFPGMIDGDVKA